MTVRSPSERGAASLGALLSASALALVVALAAFAVHAADPIPRSADPMTMAGQKARISSMRKHTPSPLLIPDQTIPLRFSHQRHVDLLACVDCHQDINLETRVRPAGGPSGILRASG